MKQLLERDIERYLVKRVKELGGEVRKVQWVGRRGAPDRLVMLHPTMDRVVGGALVLGRPPTTWVEVKKPGGIAAFPCDARERAQQREHKRMRAAGQTVVLVDSYEGVDELLA